MNVEIGTDTPIFFFCEYLFRNFGILSLQCIRGAHIDRLETGSMSGMVWLHAHLPVVFITCRYREGWWNCSLQYIF